MCIACSMEHIFIIIIMISMKLFCSVSAFSVFFFSTMNSTHDLTKVQNISFCERVRVGIHINDVCDICFEVSLFSIDFN